jgi:hypothetical protein
MSFDFLKAVKDVTKHIDTAVSKLVDPVHFSEVTSDVVKIAKTINDLAIDSLEQGLNQAELQVNDAVVGTLENLRFGDRTKALNAVQTLCADVHKLGSDLAK